MEITIKVNGWEEAERKALAFVDPASRDVATYEGTVDGFERGNPSAGLRAWYDAIVNELSLQIEE